MLGKTYVIILDGVKFIFVVGVYVKDTLVATQIRAMFNLDI